MTRMSVLRSAAIALVTVAPVGSVPVSAATIPHTPPRPPVAQTVDASGVPNASALPYLCTKGEVNTRLEKKVCL